MPLDQVGGVEVGGEGGVVRAVEGRDDAVEGLDGAARVVVCAPAVGGVWVAVIVRVVGVVGVVVCAGILCILEEVLFFFVFFVVGRFVVGRGALVGVGARVGGAEV